MIASLPIGISIGMSIGSASGRLWILVRLGARPHHLIFLAAVVVDACIVIKIDIVIAADAGAAGAATAIDIVVTTTIHVLLSSRASRRPALRQSCSVPGYVSPPPLPRWYRTGFNPAVTSIAVIIIAALTTFIILVLTAVSSASSVSRGKRRRRVFSSPRLMVSSTLCILLCSMFCSML